MERGLDVDCRAPCNAQLSRKCIYILLPVVEVTVDEMQNVHNGIHAAICRSQNVEGDYALRYLGDLGLQGGAPKVQLGLEAAYNVDSHHMVASMHMGVSFDPQKRKSLSWRRV